MTTPHPTDVRWSPSENVLYVHPVDAPDRWVCQPAAPRRAASWAVPSLPADAVRLVPDETNNDALMAYAMKWQAERAAGIPRGAITAAESVTGNYLMNYDSANGDLHSLARAIVAEIAGALVVLPGDAPAVDGAGTATPADARQRAVETAGQWLHLDPKAWQRNPAIAGTVDALIARPDVLAALAARTSGEPRVEKVVRQSASELDRTTFGDDAHAAFCDGTCKDWEAGDQLPGTGGRMCPQQPGRSLLAGGEQQ